LCASMAVPFIFSSVQIDNKLYVDGGVEEVIPATPFLSKKHEDVKALEVNMKKGTQVTDIASFSKQILGSLIKNRVHFQNINNTLINLEEYDVLDFKMKDITKLELYVRGYLTNG
jgi:predicted acylesterase/phospholipase RssA